MVFVLPARRSPGSPPIPRRTRAALKVIAVSFFALAAYVTVEPVRALFGAEDADHSTVGIVLAAVSLLTMPFFLLAASNSNSVYDIAGRSRAGDPYRNPATSTCTSHSATAAGTTPPEGGHLR
ncbi:putative secreted protein [Saccharothrix espanaensis DSM 44229]|uniref:Putative secreted protein n=1 Tax=Saccharothrix espanaensis (strain ATCC 51144 / DSM 44229 / JCM 9112 / NBRC 15066 / NRRL 15764) TaxID=1179773 RepID=K0JY11_SACES|nr:putative secreted protein [Saccharothrix espanaensis DSM 44229]